MKRRNMSAWGPIAVGATIRHDHDEDGAVEGVVTNIARAETGILVTIKGTDQVEHVRHIFVCHSGLVLHDFDYDVIVLQPAQEQRGLPGM